MFRETREDVEQLVRALLLADPTAAQRVAEMIEEIVLNDTTYGYPRTPFGVPVFDQHLPSQHLEALDAKLNASRREMSRSKVEKAFVSLCDAICSLNRSVIDAYTLRWTSVQPEEQKRFAQRSALVRPLNTALKGTLTVTKRPQLRELLEESDLVELEAVLMKMIESIETRVPSKAFQKKRLKAQETSLAHSLMWAFVRLGFGSVIGFSVQQAAKSALAIAQTHNFAFKYQSLRTYGMDVRRISELSKEKKSS